MIVDFSRVFLHCLVKMHPRLASDLLWSLDILVLRLQHTSPHQGLAVLGIEPRALCTPGKHFAQLYHIPENCLFLFFSFLLFETRS